MRSKFGVLKPINSGKMTQKFFLRLTSKKVYHVGKCSGRIPGCSQKQDDWPPVLSPSIPASFHFDPSPSTFARHFTSFTNYVIAQRKSLPPLPPLPVLIRGLTSQTTAARCLPVALVALAALRSSSVCTDSVEHICSCSLCTRCL